MQDGGALPTAARTAGHQRLLPLHRLLLPEAINRAKQLEHTHHGHLLIRIPACSCALAYQEVQRIHHSRSDESRHSLRKPALLPTPAVASHASASNTHPTSHPLMGAFHPSLQVRCSWNQSTAVAPPHTAAHRHIGTSAHRHIGTSAHREREEPWQWLSDKT